LYTFSWVNEAEKQWNEKSKFWNKNSREMWEKGSRKTIVPFFMQYVEKGSSVCDLGCGDGYGSFKLAQAGYNVLGIDLSEDMIKLAKSTHKLDNLQFQKGNMGELSNEWQVDGIIAINSLEWTEDPRAVLLEMKKVVKPGGYLCVGILGPTAAPRSNSFRRLYGEEVICNTMMPWEFQQLALENGWKKVADLPVYKRGVDEQLVNKLSDELKQALSFMWVFMFRVI
jgi:ubiquinone/menaquinone biosynthesis C-methylase UbiE